MFKMSSAGCNAGCQSLAPFTDRVVNRFPVQTVPFILDTLVQLFHVRDPVASCTHTLVGYPTPCSQWGSDPTVRRPCRLSYQDCELHALCGRPLPKQCLLPVHGVNLTQYSNSTQHPVFIRKHSQYFCCSNELLLS